MRKGAFARDQFLADRRVLLQGCGDAGLGSQQVIGTGDRFQRDRCQGRSCRLPRSFRGRSIEQVDGRAELADRALETAVTFPRLVESGARLVLPVLRLVVRGGCLLEHLPGPLELTVGLDRQVSELRRDLRLFVPDRQQLLGEAGVLRVQIRRRQGRHTQSVDLLRFLRSVAHLRQGELR